MRRAGREQLPHHQVVHAREGERQVHRAPEGRGPGVVGQGPAAAPPHHQRRQRARPVVHPGPLLGQRQGQGGLVHLRAAVHHQAGDGAHVQESGAAVRGRRGVCRGARPRGRRTGQGLPAGGAAARRALPRGAVQRRPQDRGAIHRPAQARPAQALHHRLPRWQKVFGNGEAGCQHRLHEAASGPAEGDSAQRGRVVQRLRGEGRLCARGEAAGAAPRAVGAVLAVQRNHIEKGVLLLGA
mmetsp:Transcript_37255/g.95224  ORF Transcript_37255/g.95224 Transcript_37255/m.95224 type:complete len:240 (+) Transcript_37255:588-1307(+)